jgi:hypothetical protein
MNTYIGNAPMDRLGREKYESKQKSKKNVRIMEVAKDKLCTKKGKKAYIAHEE